MLDRVIAALDCITLKNFNKSRFRYFKKNLKKTSINNL